MKSSKYRKGKGSKSASASATELASMDDAASSSSVALEGSPAVDQVPEEVDQVSPSNLTNGVLKKQDSPESPLDDESAAEAPAKRPRLGDPEQPSQAPLEERVFHAPQEDNTPQQGERESKEGEDLNEAAVDEVPLPSEASESHPANIESPTFHKNASYYEKEVKKLWKGSHPKLISQKRALTKRLEEKLWMADLWRAYQLEVYQKLYEADKRQAEREYENEKNLIKEKLISELMERKQRLLDEKAMPALGSRPTTDASAYTSTVSTAAPSAGLQGPVAAGPITAGGPGSRKMRTRQGRGQTAGDTDDINAAAGGGDAGSLIASPLVGASESLLSSAPAGRTAIPLTTGPISSATGATSGGSSKKAMTGPSLHYSLSELEIEKDFLALRTQMAPLLNAPSTMRLTRSALASLHQQPRYD